MVLQEAVMHYTRLHLAPGSRHTYDTGVRAYTRFAAYFRPRVPAFPATDEALQAFVSFQAMSCQYGTLKTYLYGLREYHLARGLAFAPLADRVGLWWTLKGIRRVHGRPAKPKQALTFPILLRVYHAAVGGGDGLHGDAHTVFTAMLVGMFGMLRKDNLTSGKTRAARDDAGIRRGDVTFVVPADGGRTIAWLRVRGSKTNQFSERTHLVPFVEVGGPLCPVTALRRHLEEVPAGPEEPLFLLRPVARRPPAPLTHSLFVGRMKAMLRAAGESPDSFAGHSLRRGGATLAFSLGLARHLVKAQGDWLSDIVDHYNEMDAAARLALPRALALHVASLQA
jgi:hypothetical protein